MKNRLIYENLDTSFVNLAALVRFLCARAFAGSVQIELGEYEGEIFFTTNNEPVARERDRTSGRVAEGEEALRRLLIRAREPGGIVHVYQTAAETANVLDDPKNPAEPIEDKRDGMIAFDSAAPLSSPVRTFQQPLSLTHASHFAENPVRVNKNVENADSRQANAETKTNSKSADFPFAFSNQVEAKARENQLSEADWQTLLLLAAELLEGINDTLARNNLNFPAAFEKARAEIANDYTFLDPSAEIFIYQNGKIEMREQVNAKLFAAGVNEALRRILAKLAANPKFAEPHRQTAQKILALVRRHKSLYDQFFITPQLEKILGV